MNEKILITNIQRFSLHDGPGIRTTIFLKGCSLRCPWCSNPENLNAFPEKYICNDNEGLYGKEYSAEEVFIEIMKDNDFYEPNGGVTFSGGEPLLRANGILPILEKVKKAGISTALETSLFAPSNNLLLLIPYIDYFYVDMKIMDTEKCRDILKGDIELFKKNLNILCSKKEITVRIPVIGNYTDDEKNQSHIIEILKKFKNKIVRIELMKEHNLGRMKYISLHMNEPKFVGVSNDALRIYKKRIESEINVTTVICQL